MSKSRAGIKSADLLTPSGSDASSSASDGPFNMEGNGEPHTVGFGRGR